MTSGKSKAKERTSPSVRDLLIPSSIMLCADVIVGIDSSVTFVRGLDELATWAFPIYPSMFLAVEFCRPTNVTVEEITKAQVLLKVLLVNPLGEETDLGEYPPSPPLQDRDWNLNRLILNLTNNLGLKNFGQYRFQIFGKCGKDSYSLLLERTLMVVKIAAPPGMPERVPVARK